MNHDCPNEQVTPIERCLICQCDEKIQSLESRIEYFERNDKFLNDEWQLEREKRKSLESKLNMVVESIHKNLKCTYLIKNNKVTGNHVEPCIKCSILDSIRSDDGGKEMK